jgi:hypothetical protein
MNRGELHRKEYHRLLQRMRKLTRTPEHFRSPLSWWGIELEPVKNFDKRCPLDAKNWRVPKQFR